MRVLVLSNFFPQPGNELLGPWALHQAQALARQGAQVTVVSPLVGFPRVLARVPGSHPKLASARRWAACPPFYRWEHLDAYYLRWPLPHFGPHRGSFYRHPQREARIGWLSLRRRLMRIVDRYRPDVVYAHGTPLCGYLGRQIKRERGTPFVTVDHDFSEVGDCARFPDRLAHYRGVAADASAAIADCRRLEDDIQRLLAPRRTVTLNTAADALPGDLPKPERPRNGTVVFSAAAFAPRKGMPLLVEAFARAAQSHPDAALRIAGDGAERSEVERAIRETGVSERVELLGFLPHRAFLAEMANCDLFALVGWEEPCATVYMNAMSAGKPIVCCSDGGITDVLEHGVQGFTVRPRDISQAAEAISRLLEDKSERQRMGEEGRKLHGERLTWDANAKRLHQVLSKAASSTSTGQ